MAHGTAAAIDKLITLNENEPKTAVISMLRQASAKKTDLI